MAELPTLRLAFQDYIASVTRLMLAATSIDRATDLFKAVLIQAIELRQTSEWVAAELTFEVAAQLVGDRQSY